MLERAFGLPSGKTDAAGLLCQIEAASHAWQREDLK
jgi:hypothetical protein